MGNYVENNLMRNESIVKEAERNPIALFWTWVKGILFFWVLFIPLISAIIQTIQFCNMEMAVTNKRILGKVGVFNTISIDSPLDKIQTVTVQQGLFGKIFNYGTVTSITAAGKYEVPYIKNADAFKRQLMSQIEIYQEEQMQLQAQKMASAMSGVVNH